MCIIDYKDVLSFRKIKGIPHELFLINLKELVDWLNYKEAIDILRKYKKPLDEDYFILDIEARKFLRFSSTLYGYIIKNQEYYAKYYTIK